MFPTECRTKNISQIRVGTFDYIREEVRKVSDSNSFSKLVGKYYINGESVIPVSSLDNELVIKLLKEYWR